MGNPEIEKRAFVLKSELNRYLEILISHYSPEKVILFGSLSKDRIHEWSDIDIIVIKDTNKPFLDRIKELILLLKPRVGIDILVYSPLEFESLSNNRSFFKEEIVNHGKIIYDRNREKMA